MNNTRGNFTMGIVWTAIVGTVGTEQCSVPTVMVSANGHVLCFFNFNV